MSQPAFRQRLEHEEYMKDTKRKGDGRPGVPAHQSKAIRLPKRACGRGEQGEDEEMVVNGLTLPAGLVELIKRDGATSDWMLKEERDAYGHRWESGAELELYTDLERIKAETDHLPVKFKLTTRTSEEIERGNAIMAAEFGFVPFITDFSEIVRMGGNAEGDACCLDYRNDRNKPSVIFWEDCYWRRVAPDFNAFMRLFDLYDGLEYLRRYNPEALPGILRELSEQRVDPPDMSEDCLPNKELNE